MKKIMVYVFSFMLIFSASCKQVRKWFGKSGMSNEEISTLVLQKQELEKRIRTDSANYAREIEALRMEYEQKLAQFEAANRRSASGFFVVVGSFKNLQLAETYTGTIKSQGRNSELIEGPNNFYCVTIGMFTDLNSALPVLQDARTAITPDSWIYIK
jgi:cell division protein FtsN